MMLFFHTLNRSSVIRPYKKLEISWQAALSAKLFRKLDTIFVRACTLVRLHSGPWVRDVRESTIAFARRPGKLDVSLGAFGVLQEAIMTARSFRS